MALPSYRNKCSKHRFTPPQLLATPCLMRNEDWTFCETEVRLAEHHELRTALGLDHAPDSTTRYRFLRRLNETVLEQRLRAVIQRLFPQPRSQTTVAVDAAGLAPSAISTVLVRRVKDREPGLTWRHWRKWTMVVDLEGRLILTQTARHRPTNDGAPWRPLVSAAHEQVPIGLVLADAEFDRERHHQHIPPRAACPERHSGQAWRRRLEDSRVRSQMRQEFPAALYRQRALLKA
jgi:hypothetical protein